jgi:hypothetical protein
MANSKITDLSATAGSVGTAEFAANEGGNDVKYTRDEITEDTDATHAAYVVSNDAAVALKAPLASPTFTGTIDATGAVTSVAAPSSGSDATTKTYVDTADNLRVLKSGSTMTGALVLSGAPVAPSDATTKSYVDTADALNVLKAGDTMTGLLVLSADPSAALGAATKQYVDAVITSGLKVPSTIDCTANPNYPASSAGDTYQVIGAGLVGGGSGVAVEVDDLIICITDSVAGTHAAVGTSFIIVQHNVTTSTTTTEGILRLATTAEVQNEAIDGSTVAAIGISALLEHQSAMRDITVYPDATSSPGEANTGYLIVLHDIVAGSDHVMTLPDPSAMVNPTLCTFVVMCGIDGVPTFNIDFDHAGGGNVNGVLTYTSVTPDHPIVCVNDGANWYAR